MTRLARYLLTILLSSLVGVAGSGSAATETASSQRAEWVPKDVHFVFQGFTTKYSCAGLQAKVKDALLQLGARKGLRVEEGACSSPAGGPEPFPNLNVKMSVLQLLSPDNGDTKAVPAHWHTVDLRLDRDPLWQAEDCELLEQIKHTFLPLFTARNVDYHSSCVPHQVSPGGTWLRAEVLVADREGAAQAAPPK